MTKRLLAALLTGAAALSCMAKVEWLETEYDFGLMKEAAGPKTGKARFVNRGDKPVMVVGMRPSCGCTTTGYPFEAVAPGDTARVYFTYDPAGRPGRFDKTVRVRFGDGQHQTIRIIGNVLGTAESLAQFYPVDAGALRLSEDKLFLGNVTKGKSPSSFVNVYNSRPDSVSVGVKSLSKAVKVQTNAEKAGPGDILTVGLYFNSHMWPKPGPFEIPVEITAVDSEGKVSPHTIRVAGTLIPERTAVGAKELAKAPRCVAAPPVADMGNVRMEITPVDFTILNEGKSTLDILNVWTSNPAVKVLGYDAEIKKRKSGKVTVELDSQILKPGAFRFDVNVATNDPAQPVLTLSVAGIKE